MRFQPSKPDRKHFAETLSALSGDAAGMYEQECDSYFNGLSDGYDYATQVLRGEEKSADRKRLVMEYNRLDKEWADLRKAQIEADRKRRGETVAGYTMVPVEPTPQMIAAFRSGFQNELHKNDRRRTMSAEEAGLRAMLKATPQPAEPVKVPNKSEGENYG